MRKILKNVFSNRNRILLSEMVRTDFKLRYQNSVLGYLWSLIKPLLLFGILYIVFTRFLHIGKGVPNWPITLLLGIVMWNFFTESTSNSLKSIVSRGSLVRKINIPRYLIPVSVIASSLINLLLNLVVVMVFVIFSDNTPLSPRSFILFPLLLLELIIASVSVSFFLSAVYVKYRDIEHIWDVAKQALFYVVPIIYPLTMIPNVLIQKILILNPLAQIMQDARAVITYGDTPQIYDIFDSWLQYIIPLGIVIITLAISSAYFRKNSKYFAEDI